MFNKLSMRAKLLTIICAICAVAMLQIGLISRESLNALRTGKESQMRAATESLVDKIDRNLFERYGDVQAFALSDPARSGSPERINHFINDMMGVYTPVYDMMIVTNSKGKVISVNSVNKSGKPVDTAFMIGKDYSDRAWFQAAIKGEIKDAMTFVEDLQLDEDVAKATRGSGKVMNFTAPIKDKTTGEILGVWSNRMSWDDVVDQIKKEESEKIKSDRITEVFGYILDANGQFLIHPLGDEFALKKSFPGFEKAKVSAKEHSLIEHVDLKSSFFSGEVIQVISPSKGYGSYPGKGWYSILQVPATDSQFDYTTRMIFFSILFQIVGMLTAFFIIRGLVTVFSNVASQLRMEANQVSSASANISSASRNLAQATGQQASALQETAASIEEMNAMVKKSSENANRSRDVAQTSHEVATKGKQAVEQMVGAITEIDTSNASIMRQVEESNRQISEIVKVITEIGNKTKVINDIVFQTKLLSFNASVEAARAGEHGKGFAVVAEEVGNLAQMSGNAAKEISDMLNGSISKVESIVNDTKVKVERLIAEGKSKVESGTVVAKQCGEILEEVVKNVSEVNSMIGEISTASHEQAQGISEITKAMNQMDQVTHSNAATSQEAASSSQQLSSQSESLLRVVKTLDSTINGASYIHTESPDSSPPDSDRKNKGNGAKVIQLSERRTHHASNSETPKKSVALADSVPSEDDPRFKEV